MSTLTVNTIEPRTEPKVNFLGLNAPSFQGEELAIRNQVLPLSGGTMTGFPVLPGNATSNLQAVPKQQLDSAVTGLVGTRVANDSGYLVLPGLAGAGPGFTTSIIFQWVNQPIGDVAVGNPGSTGSITWPTAFPTACLTVQTTIHVSSGQLNNLVAAITSMSTSGATFQVQEWSAGSNPCTVHFLAIGY